MKVGRLKRYKDKLDLVDKRVEEVDEWKENFLSDEKSKLACYKAFQEIVEAGMDVVAMLIKDRDLIPKDDYANVDIVEKNKLLSKKVCGALREMNGLRNRIIHEYNGLSDKIALESMGDLFPKIEIFVGEIEKWLRKLNSKN